MLIVGFISLFSFSLFAQQPAITPLRESAPAPAPDPIFRQELKLWKALATHDLDGLELMLAPDFVFVGDKFEDRGQTIASIGSCEPRKFSFLSPKSRMVTSDVAIITYRASQDLACGTGHKPGDVNESSTWVKRNGQWLLQMHTEVRVSVR